MIQYEYDVFGRRIYKNIDGLERSYIYDREDILAIFEKQEDGSFNLAMKYLHGPGIDEPIKGFGRDFNETYYADGLGSIVKVERDNGEFFNLVYDSFGRVTVFDKEHQKITLTKDSLLTYGYTGREIDAESGFNYYRARYYSPETGRFISEDPIGFEGMDPNLYRYASNSALNFKDPLGTFFIPGAIVGAISGAISGAIAAYNASGDVNAAVAGAISGLIIGGVGGGLGPFAAIAFNIVGGVLNSLIGREFTRPCKRNDIGYDLIYGGSIGFISTVFGLAGAEVFGVVFGGVAAGGSAVGIDAIVARLPRRGNLKPTGRK